MSLFEDKEVQEMLEGKLGGKIGKMTSTLIGVGQGYVSNIRKLCIEWSKGGTLLPKSVIYKEPQGNDAMNAEIVGMLHKRECDFYKLCMDEKCSPIPAPKCYGFRELTPESGKGILLLEDLSGRARVPKLDVEPLTMNQVETLCAELASLHALSLRNDCWTTTIQPNSPEVVYWIRDESFKYLVELHKNFPEAISAERVELIRKLLPDGEALLRVFQMHNKELGMPNVITHSDLYSFNILFERNEDGSLSSKIAGIIDWQFVVAGSPVQDLCSTLVSSTENAFHFQYLDQILAFYLKELLGRLPEPPAWATLENLKKAYLGMLPLGYLVFNSVLAANIMMRGEMFQDPNTDQEVKAQLEAEKKRLLERKRTCLNSFY